MKAPLDHIKNIPGDFILFKAEFKVQRGETLQGKATLVNMQGNNTQYANILLSEEEVE